MIKLKVVSKHWEIEVDVGNDHGEPSYMETRKYATKEEVEHALELKDYYEIIESIKHVTEYEEEWEKRE